MEDQILVAYCLIDDLLKGLNHYEDSQTRMSDAEVMVTALVAALFFSGNYRSSRAFLDEQGYIPYMLSESRFSRRLHRLHPLFLSLFEVLGETFKELNEQSIYLIDTFPIPSIDNSRARRSHLHQGKGFWGYQSSKKRYYYGLKLHLMVSKDGLPVESPCGSGSALFLNTCQFQ